MILYILQKLIIGKSKSWIHGKELSVAGHKHSEYANKTHKHALSDITDFPSGGPFPSNITWVKQAELTHTANSIYDIYNKTVTTVLDDIHHDYIVFVIDELSGSYYNDSIAETYTFYIDSFIDPSYLGSNVRSNMLSVEIELNTFYFSAVKLPIYMIYQRSSVTHDKYNNSVYQYYKTLNGDESSSRLESSGTRTIGFFFKTSKNINFNNFDNFTFKGSIYTGDYDFA